MQETPTHYRRRLSILIPLWLFWPHGNTIAAQDTNTRAAPNIVLFLVDDMGWQDTSVNFGSEVT
ncbi:MAG: hypothetical protein L7W43_14435, partial [Rubripirellula sp.]|nr:hypothetical protein [Rubripirellula sp.]